MNLDLVRRIRASRFATDAGILVVGTAIGHGVLIVSTPVLTRLYTPQAFGLMAICSAVVVLVATGVTLRYETAVFLPKDDRGADAVVWLAVGLSTLLSAALVLLVVFVPSFWLQAAGLASLGLWLPLAVLAGGVMGIATTLGALLARQKEFVRLAMIKGTQPIVTAIVGVVSGLGRVDNGLIVAVFAGVAVTCFVSAMMVGRVALASIHEAREAARSYQRAPKFLLPTSLIDTFTQQLPVILITGWFGAAAAGQYSLAWRILALPTSVIGFGVSQVFFQRFAQVWPDAAAARHLLLRSWKGLLAIGVLPCLLVLGLGPSLFVAAFGDHWLDAGRFARALALMALTMFVSSPTSSTYVVLGLQQLSLCFGVSFLLYRVICLYLGHVTSSLQLGLFLWAMCEIVAIALYNAIAWRRTTRP